MKTRTLVLASVLIGLALGLAAALPAEAQQHKATVLGNPATRFAKPLKKPDDLRVLLRSERMKADVAAVLKDAGWPGDPADFDRAAAAADIVSVEIAPGTTLPFMAARKNGKAYAMKDVLWAGKKPIDAFAFEFSSGCMRYRLVTPKACSNFWLENLGKDTADAKCAPPPPPPVVSVSGASETCVTQPVEYAITVKNPPADNKVSPLRQRQGAGLRQAHERRLQVHLHRRAHPGHLRGQGRDLRGQAVSGGVSGTTSVQVKPCVPTCGITASPLPAHAGKPFTVDLAGSRVATGVQGGVKSAKIEVVDPKGTVVNTFEMGPAGLSRNDIVIKKAGIHTLRAVVTDEAGQTSTNACQAQVDVKGGPPIFAGGYFGKERMTHDDLTEHSGHVAEFSRCSPEVGFEIGVQPKIGEHSEFEAALGIKFPFDDDAHTAIFADAAVNRLAAAVNRLAGKGFFGGGLSYWDIGKDSGGIGILLQGGFDLDKNGKWQLVGQARAPFSQFDNIDNNYQVWAGFRFRPNSWK